ncbi:uncharacterized protein LOC110254012 [Exaiptasia diaphana]|uniref:Uncharacterized protein n=1 Tax=Exaiptasia diaphana TaxID=2652724 RepID=A0A913Y839_EXADI|nr:uncharacterized protein LOC110254012 [Exaiptasia diaphana]KXJ21547.1 hypothetical protein AC249_AIPGENE1061 [Exaiptasia diaphana]
MSDIDTIPDDVHSLISLSSSTIGSNRLDDVESTDSQDYADVAGSRERFKQLIDSQGKASTQSRINSYLFDSETKNATDNLSEENKEEKQNLDLGTEDDKTDENPFLKSIKYLEQEGILRLFQNLAADIVFNRPDQPLQYIVEKLKKEKDDFRDENDNSSSQIQ